MKIDFNLENFVRKGSSFEARKIGNNLALFSFGSQIAYLNLRSKKLHRTWKYWSVTSMQHIRKCFGIKRMTKDMWFSIKQERTI